MIVGAVEKTTWKKEDIFCLNIYHDILIQHGATAQTTSHIYEQTDEGADEISQFPKGLNPVCGHYPKGR